MIDIEGLTEVQVRYILKELLEMEGNNLLEEDVLWIKGNSDYPQNNEEGKMIKKIKIVSRQNDNGNSWCLRDTTVGSIYDATVTPVGGVYPDGIVSTHEGLSFIDDVGDWVTLLTNSTSYEVVAQPEIGITDNKIKTSHSFDWSSVDNDIEAVVLSSNGELISIYRTIRGNLHFANTGWEELAVSTFNSLKQVELSCKDLGKVFLLRPTREVEEVEDKSIPSINDILQEAQQAILQHHNIRGKVRFTVTTE